jgi:3-dehydroquinate dehydratase II
MQKIAIINGPNLNLLGTREPQIYGVHSFDDYYESLQAKNLHCRLHYFQSNIEGEIINYLHECLAEKFDGIIINAGAYTHTSIAIADAIAAINIPTVEVHISNVMAREEYRKTSFLATKCVGSISGLGLKGYELALLYFISTEKVNE